MFPSLCILYLIITVFVLNTRFFKKSFWGISLNWLKIIFLIELGMYLVSLTSSD